MKKNYITPATRSIGLESVNAFFDNAVISIYKETTTEDGDYDGVTNSGDIQSNVLDKTFNWRD